MFIAVSVLFGLISLLFIVVVSSIMSSKEGLLSCVFVSALSVWLFLLSGGLGLGFLEENQITVLLSLSLLLFLPIYLLILTIKKNWGAIILKALG